MIDFDLKKARVYVGTYKKYNNGNLSGGWLDISDYSDEEEFLDACNELHKDERNPEFMFQDWENIPAGCITESYIDEMIFDLVKETSDFDETEMRAFPVWIDVNYPSMDIENFNAYDLINNFTDEYCGTFESEKSFAEDIAAECYPEIESSPIGMYFDYEAFARDLFITDYLYMDGFVFRR